jgi:hypothetical protein
VQSDARQYHFNTGRIKSKALFCRKNAEAEASSFSKMNKKPKK